jgi:hypothetical protein
MIELHKGMNSGILIKPRWFAKSVFIDGKAFEAVQKAQSILPSDIRLVITRAYQPEDLSMRFLRLIGAMVFKFIYPMRAAEIPEIFGHNGHALDGRHVDIGIEYKNKILKLLPFSVFTSLDVVINRSERYTQIIVEVQNALQECGFTIHSNKIEALQIHCDFN